MKKILLTIVSMLCAVAAGALTPDRASFYDGMMDSTNKKCPIPMGAMGNVSVAYFDETVPAIVYAISVADGFSYTLMNKPDNDPSMKKQIVETFDMTTTKMLFEMLINDGVAIKYIFMLPQSDQKVTITLTPAEMQQILNNPLSDYERAVRWVNTSVQNENAACPVSVGDGITMNSARLEGKMVVYRMTVDRDSYETLNSLGSEAKQNMLTSMSDVAMRKIVKSYATAGVGVKYIYSCPGESKPFTVEITAQDFQNIVNR